MPTPAPTPAPPSGLKPVELPRSERVLLLVDFINPLDFPGGEHLAPHAVPAAQATAALKQRLADDGVKAIFANDNYGVWQSDFHTTVATCVGLQGPAGEITRELVICGLATDICVQLTAMDAFLREYDVWVPPDCTAAETEPAKQASLASMESVLRCDTTPSTGTRRPAARRHGRR